MKVSNLLNASFFSIFSSSCKTKVESSNIFSKTHLKYPSLPSKKSFRAVPLKNSKWALFFVTLLGHTKGVLSQGNPPVPTVTNPYRPNNLPGDFVNIDINSLFTSENPLTFTFSDLPSSFSTQETRIQFQQTIPTGPSNDLTKIGNTLYSYGESDFTTFDLSSFPAQSLGSVGHNSQSRQGVTRDGFFYLSQPTSIQIINGVNPASPFVQTTVPVDGVVNAIAIDPNSENIYTPQSGPTDFVNTTDVTDPATPVPNGSFTAIEAVTSIFTSGNFTFITTELTGQSATLTVLNSENPNMLTLLGSTPVTELPISVVCFEDTFCTVAQRFDGVRTYSVEGINPQLEGTYDPNGQQYRHISLTNSRFIAVSQTGPDGVFVELLDVSDFTTITPYASINLTDFNVDVLNARPFLTGNQVYIPTTNGTFVYSFGNVVLSGTIPNNPANFTVTACDFNGICSPLVIILNDPNGPAGPDVNSNSSNNSSALAAGLTLGLGVPCIFLVVGATLLIIINKTRDHAESHESIELKDEVSKIKPSLGDQFGKGENNNYLYSYINWDDNQKNDQTELCYQATGCRVSDDGYIASGQHGSTRVVWSNELQKYIVMKTVTGEEEYKNSSQETRLQYHCSGDGVGKIYNFINNVEKKKLIIFMELYGLGNLDEISTRLTDNNLTTDREKLSKVTAFDVLKGLKRIHTENGIYHLDLKGKNIVVNASGEAASIDFGSARISKKGKLSKNEIHSSRDYLPPEISKEGELNLEAQDMWALGLTLLEFMLGDVNYTSPRKSRVIKSLLKKNAADQENQHEITTYLEEKSENKIYEKNSLWHLIHTLLSFDPKKRGSAKSALKHECFKPFESRKSTELNEFRHLFKEATPEKQGNFPQISLPVQDKEQQVDPNVKVEYFNQEIDNGYNTSSRNNEDYGNTYFN